MAQRIRRLTTDQEIAGSNPAGIVFFLLIFFDFNLLQFSFLRRAHNKQRFLIKYILHHGHLPLLLNNVM